MPQGRIRNAKILPLLSDFEMISNATCRAVSQTPNMLATRSLCHVDERFSISISNLRLMMRNKSVMISSAMYSNWLLEIELYCACGGSQSINNVGCIQPDHIIHTLIPHTLNPIIRTMSGKKTSQKYLSEKVLNNLILLQLPPLYRNI